MKLVLFMLLNSCLILKYSICFLTSIILHKLYLQWWIFIVVEFCWKGNIYFLNLAIPYTNLQPHICQNTAVLCPDVPWLWSCYWFISVMSAPGCRKEEVTSNVPFFFLPSTSNSVTQFSAKTIRAAPAPHGRGQQEWGNMASPLRMFINYPIYFQLSEKPANSQQSLLCN